MTEAAENYQPEETISGAWTDVVLVEDLGSAEETETWLTRVSGDITVSKDAEEWESNPTASRHTQSGETHVSREIEVPLDQNADEDLEEAGVFDEETGEEAFNEIHDAVRLYAHKEREDDAGEHVVEREAERCRASLGDEEFAASDPATSTLTFTVMGPYRKEITEADE